MRRIFVTALILLAAVAAWPADARAPDTGKTAVIFFNEACKDCGELVKGFYPGFFEEYGYETDLRDYINVRENRQVLNAYNEEWGVPFALQSHIETFVGDRLLLGGHVPEHVMRYVMENPGAYDRLLVFQDKMHGEETEYTVWDFEGEPRTYPIDEPIMTYLAERGNGRATVAGRDAGFWGMFALVSASAFVDGLNPCAFAVLLFFIAFLFSIRKVKRQIWKMGLVYIGAIYLAYLLIGVGIAQAFVITGAPHLMAYVGSALVIALGILQLIGAAFPAFPIRLRIPLDTKATLERWMYRATLPASFIGGFLVGLCTFPCSGGIYVAIIGLLASRATALQGFGWMAWYNLVFVAPLLILLALASNRRSVERLQVLERAESKRVKAAVGAFMVLLGAGIIIFFT